MPDAVRDRELRPFLGYRAELRKHESGDRRPLGTRRQIASEGSIRMMNRNRSDHAGNSRAFEVDARGHALVLGEDVPDDLFDHLFGGDDPDPRALLVDHESEVRVPRLYFAKDVDGERGCRNGVGLVNTTARY